MRKRPKGPKYRNLYRRSGGVIYYERVWGLDRDQETGERKKKRHRISCDTCDWDEAAAVRDEYEAVEGIGRVAQTRVEVPIFAEFAKRYLDEDTAHLAPTTRAERRRELGEEGPILASPLGLLRLDEISKGDLRQWWTAEVDRQPGRSTKTGRNYLDAISGVFEYAVELELIESNPVDDFRAILRRKARTQRGRAASDPSKKIRPIEDPAEIDRLVAAAREEGSAAYVLVLLLLDAGLRLGEALGLRWGCVEWGESEDDTRRALLIEESRPRGGAPGPTKSGRSRRVALARRLRDALELYYRESWGPRLEQHVLAYGDPSVFRRVEWRRILKRARIGHRALKDLRDSYASHLISAGVQLGYVSKQLGHADVGVTSRHYARWTGGDDYREPLRLQEGEVPADFLARLPQSPQSPPTSLFSDGDDALSDGDHWWSQRESNPSRTAVSPRKTKILVSKFLSVACR